MKTGQVDYYLSTSRNRKSIDDVIVDSAPEYDWTDGLDAHGFLEYGLEVQQLRQVVSRELTLTYVDDPEVKVKVKVKVEHLLQRPLIDCHRRGAQVLYH